MKNVDTNSLSPDECWGVQINGPDHCRFCKWTGISACVGKNIVETGRNAYGYKIGGQGIDKHDYDPGFDQRINISSIP